MIEQHTRGADGVYPTAIRGLTLFRLSAPTPPVGTVHEPSLCVVAQGAKQFVLGDKEYLYEAEQYLLVSADVPAMAWVSKASPEVPYLGLKLLLDPFEVGEVVAQLGPRQDGRAARAAAVGELALGLLDAVSRLLALLEEPQDSLVLAPLVRREVFYRLLVGPEGSRLRQLVIGNDQGQRITHVLRWLKDHYSEPLSIEAVARQAGMSPSAFHRHFKAVTALSPLQYQKRIRLQEARRLMLGEALDAAEASFRVGYESPSQFNREYRRIFGAPPRRDIEALRQGEARAPVVCLVVAK
jgi:AraC-like DNA-binding protein